VHAQSRQTGERHYDSSRVCVASVHKERGAATRTPTDALI
jgi:hypothetical protein